jgi:hypothetical protein
MAGNECGKIEMRRRPSENGTDDYGNFLEHGERGNNASLTACHLVSACATILLR